MGIASFFAFSANFFSCSVFHSSNSRFASSISKNAIIYYAIRRAVFGLLRCGGRLCDKGDELCFCVGKDGVEGEELIAVGDRLG